MTFINLPVADLPRSRRFFEQLGFEFDERFCDASAACLVISELSFAMLVTPEKFAGFAAKPVADGHASTEVMIALSADSREAVDTLAESAIASGGSAHRDADDLGFMYSRSFCDPDGHVWESFWMDPAAVPEDAPGENAAV